MVEGGGSKTFGRIKRMMYEAPRDLHRLLEVLAKATILYLECADRRGRAGGDVVRYLGRRADAGAVRGVLPALHGARSSMPLTRKAEGRRVPNIVFTKGGGAWLKKIAAIGCDAVGVDWTTDLSRRARGGRRTAWRCRVISIRPHCLRRRRCCGPRPCGFWPATARVPGMCSIWGTASRPTSIPSRSRVLIDTVQSYDLSAARLLGGAARRADYLATHRAARGAGSCRHWSWAIRCGSTRASELCSP